jgi:hypothetical protein
MPREMLESDRSEMFGFGIAHSWWQILGEFNTLSFFWYNLDSLFQAPSCYVSVVIFCSWCTRFTL